MATETSARPITVHDDTSFMKTSSVPILTANAGGSNFPPWKGRITALLRALKLLSIIEGTEVKPTTGSEPWQSRHDKAFCLLLDRIDDEQFSSIQDKGADAAACWTHLCSIHESTDLSRQFMLVRQLWMTTYDPSQTTLSAHISKMKSIKLQVTQTGFPIADNFFGILLLNSMPPSFEVVFASLATMGDTITSDKVCTRLLAEEQRITLATPSVHIKSERAALAADTAGQRGGRQGGGGKEHRDSNKKPFAKSKRMELGLPAYDSALTCAFCDRTGHDEAHCTTKAWQDLHKNKLSSEAHVATTKHIDWSDTSCLAAEASIFAYRKGTAFL
jgi:hypothetical protein